MDQADIDVRNATYWHFVEHRRVPTTAEVGDRVGLTAAEVLSAWRRLHDAHALVMDADGVILMLNPFAARPTPFVVEAAGRPWFGNCGWDALGIGAALGVNTVVRTTCADCAEPLTIQTRDGLPLDPSPVFHVLVPAVQWWDNIGFT